MERVLGIGGAFLRAKDPKALAEWTVSRQEEIDATLTAARGG